MSPGQGCDVPTGTRAASYCGAEVSRVRGQVGDGAPHRPAGARGRRLFGGGSPRVLLYSIQEGGAVQGTREGSPGADGGRPHAVEDPGLFGPGSVTWELHADPVMWVAGVRALYLQALHPRAVRGVVQNSDFRKDPWGRLFRTADFVGVTTYGTRAEAERAGARVRRIHGFLRAVDPVTGQSYRIDETALLRWVHCAEVISYVEVVRRAGFPLTDAQVDTYLAEQRASAALVGLAPDEVPASATAMREYFEDVRPALGRSPEADQVWDFLRRPPVHPVLWLGRELIWRQLAELAYGSLPSWAHGMYGHRALPPFAVTTGLRLLRTTSLAVLPAARLAGFQSPHIKAAVERLGPDAAPSRPGFVSGLLAS
ncbi:MAG: DUF2236 domain-containing protein [Streptomycetaceae bacterium]|nr:DUF2236 domain-containing protein [Streptomycetaceae bacterium]